MCCCWILIGDQIALDGLSHTGQEKTYEVKKRRFLRGRSLPEYAALEPQGKGLMLASKKPFVFTDPDGRPVEQPEPEPMEEGKAGGSKCCCWEILPEQYENVITVSRGPCA